MIKKLGSFFFVLALLLLPVTNWANTFKECEEKRVRVEESILDDIDSSNKAASSQACMIAFYTAMHHLITSDIDNSFPDPFEYLTMGCVKAKGSSVFVRFYPKPFSCTENEMILSTYPNLLVLVDVKKKLVLSTHIDK